MMQNSQDKDNISSLHGIPRNHRDASNSSMGSNLKWQREPTAIATPSNSARLNRDMINGPYGASRTRDTLHADRTTFGNQTSRSTVTRAINLSSKKRKWDQTFTENNNGHGKRKSQPKQLRNDVPPLAPDQEIILVQSDEEDLGLPITSDELNIRPAGPSSVKNDRARRNSPLHPFEMSDEQPPTSYSRTRGPTDGNNTRWLQEELGRPTSPIEDYDDEFERDGGKVKGMVADYERRRQKGVDELIRKRAAPPKIPFIDLKTGKEAPKATPNTVSIKNRMKPKDSAKGIQLLPQSQRDRSAASTSSKTPTTSQFTLPVKEWYLGHNHFREPYTLTFKKKDSQFTIGKHGHSEVIRLARDVDESTCSLDHACVQIVTKPDHEGVSAIGPDHRPSFEPGHRTRGLILFSFDEGAATWSTDAYTHFCECLRGRNQSVATGIGFWKMHVLRQQMPSRSRSVSVVAESDPEEPKRDSESVDSTLKPRTTVTYRASAKQDLGANQVIVSEVRRSSRRREASRKVTPQIDLDEVILSYPPATGGSVNITNADLSRLDPDEYLNDTLIEFGLRLWHRELEETNPELAGQVHIFNSFFYKKLMAKKSLEENYQSVSRWTSKIDLFKKKFIIVPINEAMHWYLAIIYRPDQVLQPPPKKPSLPPRVTRQSNANEIAVIGDDDAQEVQDVQAALEIDDSSSAERAKSESSRSVHSDSHPTEEEPLEEFQSSVSTTYKDPALKSKSPSPEGMVISEDSTNPDVMDVDCPIFSDSRARSSTASDEDDKPTSSTAATGRQSPLSVTHDLSMEVDNITLRDEPEHDFLSDVEISESGDAAKKSGLDKGKGKAVEIPDEDQSVAQEDVAKEDETNVPQGTMPTFICTLDSLGSKHPKAIKTLNRYLQLEAENKKKTTDTSDAVGKLVQVPLQPNFSDCGIYLLHFARIFVSKPDYFCKLPGRSRPQEERMTDWEGHGLGDARENLRKRILELSEEWKRERATKEKEQAVKEGQGEVDVVPDSDSDDDAVIIETTPPEASTPTPNNKRGGKAGRGKRAKGRGPISRPRG